MKKWMFLGGLAVVAVIATWVLSSGAKQQQTADQREPASVEVAEAGNENLTAEAAGASSDESPAFTVVAVPLSDADSPADRTFEAILPVDASDPEAKELPKTAEELKALVDAIRKIPGFTNQRRALMDLGEAMGAEDFEGALAMMKEAGLRGRSSSMLFYGVYTAAGEQDPQRALELLAEATGGNERSQYRSYYYMTGILKGWARTDLDGALGYAQGLEEGHDRYAAMRGVFRTWGELDAQAALAEMERIGGDNERYIYGALFTGWARQDPLAALEYAESNLNGRMKNSVIEHIGDSIAFHWIDGEPRATAQWIAENFPEEIQHEVLPSIYDRWTMTDPRAAAEHAVSDGFYRVEDPNDLLGDVLGSWYLEDPDAAFEWANASIEDDRLYLNVMVEMAQNLGWRDPSVAAALLDEIPELLEPDLRVLPRLVPHWTREAPNEASAWAVSIEQEDARIYAVKSAYANWAGRDRGAALESAMQLPPGNDRAYALSNVAVQQSQNRMDGGTDWILQLDPGFARDRSAAGYVLGALRGRDNNAAAAVKRSLGDYAVSMPDVVDSVRNASIDEDLRNELLRVTQ